MCFYECHSSLPAPSHSGFFYFLVAFPTLAIAWLCKVLEAVGAPEGFQNCVAAMYDALLHFDQYRGAIALVFLLDGHARGCAGLSPRIVIIRAWSSPIFGDF